MNIFGPRIYSLRKSKETLHHVFRAYRRKKKKLSSSAKKELEEALSNLQREITNKNRKNADHFAKNLESIAKHHLKKTTWDQTQDIIHAIVFALVVAILVRSIWFEPYEIPTGSMRPTLKEQDRLVVSKTNFGINLPLTTGHLYFDPNLTKRGGIFIFTGENMNISDVDTLYFYIFPGKKQYIKRLIGKPGDTLYFYGGHIYGIDSEGKDISDQFQIKELALIDHIPIINFERKISTPQPPVNGIYSPVVIYQMDEPIARLFLNSQNKIVGEMSSLPQIHQPTSPPITKYEDLWGIKNYAMARLLTLDQVKQLTDYPASDLGQGVLYLELRHHPNFTHAKLIQDEWGKVRPTLGITTSIIPLQESHVQEIFKQLYTARFFIKNGFAYRHGSNPKNHTFHPFFPEVPDGCYEFYYGKLYQVKWQGIIEELPSTHPLNQYSSQLTQLLFNIGMEFDTHYLPQVKNQLYVPSRYSYFRDGDLYLLGAPILKQTDPTMIAFVEQEKNKEYPFVDLGPPLKSDGSLDIDFIKQYGLMIPPKTYLALGDNHAMSSDSRDFGFVPQDNVRGAPDFILWPPGNRWGEPNQPVYPLITRPRLIIWLAAAICLGIWYIRHRKRSKLLLNFNDTIG